MSCAAPPKCHFELEWIAWRADARREMEERGWTHSSLAAVLGVSRETVSSVLAPAGCRRPSVLLFCAMGRVLGLNPLDYTTGLDEPAAGPR